MAGPHLDLDPLPLGARGVTEYQLSRDWLRPGVEELARSWAATHSQPDHRETVACRVLPLVSRTRTQVEARLHQQINHWSLQAVKLAGEVAAGKKVRTSPERARRWAEELEVRLDTRLAELDDEAHLVVRPPQILTAALVVPAGLLPAASIERTPPVDTRISERRAVDAVLAAERSLGRAPTEMAHNNPGYDIASLPGDGGPTVFIEVKGRVAGAEDFVVTATEVLQGKNTAPHYRLALVSVHPDGPAHDEIRYVDDPFAGYEITSFATTRVVLDWAAAWARASPPH